MRKALSLKTNNVIVTNKSKKTIDSKRVLDDEENEVVSSKKAKYNETEQKKNNMIYELERRMEEKLQNPNRNEPSEKKQKNQDIRTWLQKRLSSTSSDRRREKDPVILASDDYFFDMLQYMKSRQMVHRPPHDYMLKQKDLVNGMRVILIDWLHDVITNYGLQTETLHLTVSIVDRFISVRTVMKEQLQLVGTSALLIASKYEESAKYVPKIDVFSIITQNTYSVDDILRMEMNILQQLDFVIVLPTALWFASCFANRAQFTRKMKKTAQYLLNLSLLELDFLRFPPSSIAAAVICFSNILSLTATVWSDDLQKDTGIEKNDFQDCLKQLENLFVSAPENHQRMHKKYSSKENDQVALLPVPRELFLSFQGEEI